MRLVSRIWNALLVRAYRRILSRLSTTELDDELEYWQIRNHETLYRDAWDLSMLNAIQDEYHRRNLLLPA